jgi:hypothetical protein
MSGTSELATLVVQKVRAALQEELVSVGEVRQIIADPAVAQAEGSDPLEQVLRRVLADDVEIGYAKNVGGTYVEFVAWKGSIAERCERAYREVDTCGHSDRGFAFWLCLRANVDEYEAE